MKSTANLTQSYNSFGTSWTELNIHKVRDAVVKTAWYIVYFMAVVVPFFWCIIVCMYYI